MVLFIMITDPHPLSRDMSSEGWWLTLDHKALDEKEQDEMEQIVSIQNFDALLIKFSLVSKSFTSCVY